MPYRTLFREQHESLVCQVCGAYVDRRKKHRRWHKQLRRLEERVAASLPGSGVPGSE